MTVRILHLHSTFSLGGKEARAVRLMNAWGGAASHVILSAMPEHTGASAAIAPGIDWRFDPAAPSLAGKPGPLRYLALARYMRGFDLVLSYNWGSMDGVMARRVLGGPPLVHHEDGFNADEAEATKPKRDLFRRVGLTTAAAVVVPSARLEAIAREKWGAGERLKLIANGVPVADYASGPTLPRAALGLREIKTRPVVGTLAGLRAVKNLPRLVRAVAASGADCDLVIVGEGPEREAIATEAARLGVSLHLPGFLAEPARYVGHFDVFALSSDSEQAPISLIEAMAAGVPVAAPAVGDVAAMVSVGNRRFVTPPGDEAALATSIGELLREPALRAAIGAANRAEAAARFDERAMIATYRALYEGAMGRPGALA